MFKKILAGILCCTLTVGAAPASLAAAAEEAYPELRVHYAFDGEKKNAADSSGNARDGIIYGTSELSPDGVYGQSLLLKGGYIHMPGDIFGDSAALTISIWTRPMRSATWSRVWDIGNNTNYYLTLMAPSGDGKFACELKDGTTDSDKARATSQKAYSQGAWKQLTVTYSENGALTLFENGASVGSVNVGSLKTSDFGNITRAFIGRSMFSPDADYYGYIDDFKIYGGVLSQQQISDEYKNGCESVCARAAESIDIAKSNSLGSLSAVCQNLVLPTKIAADGVSVAWESSDLSVITNTGKLSAKTGAATLTATVSRDGVTKTKSFDINTAAAGQLKADPIGDIATVVGKKPTLPAKISANGGTAALKVDWEQPDPTEYGYAQTAVVTGVAENGEKVSAALKTVDSMSNLLIQNGAADPYITYHDGYYYYVRSEGGISVAKSRRLSDIGTAPRIVVYTPPATGMYSKEYWAPEIHYIDGCWYVYVAADDGNNANHRMYCLKSTEPDNAQAKYEMAGKLAPTAYNEASQKWEIIPEQDKWAIDGTVLPDVNGKNYFIWSGWEGNTDGQQNLYIAEMLDPYTLKGSRMLLCKPDQYWEQKGQTGVLVEEGAQIVKHGSKVYVLYSCNGSWTDWYSIGSMSADISSDLLKPESWSKSQGPLFTQSLNPADYTYGTGHACVVPSPDEKEYYFVYHAFHSAGGGWEDRSGRIVKFDFDGDVPVLGNPMGESEYLSQPSGTEAAISAKYEAETAELKNVKVGAEGSRSGGRYAMGVGTDGLVTFNAKVPQSGLYRIDLMGGCRSVTSGNCYLDLTVNDKTTVKVRFRINESTKKTFPASLASSDTRDGVYLPLAKGVNKISVTRSADSGGNGDIDFLHLLRVSDDESLKSVESVSISEQTKTLTEGETASLTATAAPADAVSGDIIWKSSNPGVAAVSADGTVTAAAPGTATITAVSYNNPEAKAVCTVTVKAKSVLQPPKPVLVSSVRLSAARITLNVKAKKALTAAISPADAVDKNVTFKSSNAKVASVSANGTVTAVSPGKATITAAAGGKTASCVVTVRPGVVKKLKAVKKGKKLSVKFKKGAGSKYTSVTVYRNGKKVKTASVKGKAYIYTVKKKGKYLVKATACAKSGKTVYKSAAAKSKTVKFK